MCGVAWRSLHGIDVNPSRSSCEHTQVNTAIQRGLDSVFAALRSDAHAYPQKHDRLQKELGHNPYIC